MRRPHPMRAEPALFFHYSRLIPFSKEESPTQRHRRRRLHALAHAPIVQEWCNYRGVSFHIKGTGDNLWSLRLPNAFLQWCPSRGRCSFSSDTTARPVTIRRAKCLDYTQMLQMAELWIGQRV